MSSKRFTSGEDNFIKSVWGKENYSAAVIGRMLKRRPGSITNRATLLGLRERNAARPQSRADSWTVEDDSLMLATITLLAEQLHRTPTAVIGRALKLTYPGGDHK